MRRREPHTKASEAIERWQGMRGNLEVPAPVGNDGVDVQLKRVIASKKDALWRLMRAVDIL